MILYPELKRLGKRIVIGSYSFGPPEGISGDAPIIFQEGYNIAKKVTANSIPDPYYGPEVHICSFLDQKYPESAPHFVYAYYARAFSVPRLRRLYQQFIAEHDIDAIVLMDGGSDSLMVGDEEGLGDPVEDAISVTTVASLTNLKLKVLVSVSLGTDRYLHVSDSASLRAVAELTASGGFLGAVSIEPSSTGFQFYKACLDHIYAGQGFQSVHVGTIVSAVEGYYGEGEIPPPLAQTHVRKEKLFLWPIMAILWAFDVDKVAERSMIAEWIRDCDEFFECHGALGEGRRALGENVRDVENLPRHEDMRK
jgi:hypothetical protein